jgi:hypothetical protein
MYVVISFGKWELKREEDQMRMVGKGRLIFNPLHVFIMSFCMRWLIFDPKRHAK